MQHQNKSPESHSTGPERSKTATSGRAPLELDGHGNAAAQARLASAAAGDSPVDPGLLARAQCSLGRDLSDVRLRVDPQAAAKGYAALALGRVILVDPLALGPSGEALDPELIAHELVHIAHQDAQPGDPGVDTEQEADAGAAAILKGQPFQVLGDASSGVGQAKSWGEWMRGWLSVQTQVDGEEVVDPAQAESAPSLVQSSEEEGEFSAGVLTHSASSSTSARVAPDSYQTEGSGESRRLDLAGGGYSVTRSASVSTDTVDPGLRAARVAKDLSLFEEKLDKELQVAQDAHQQASEAEMAARVHLYNMKLMGSEEDVVEAEARRQALLLQEQLLWDKVSLIEQDKAALAVAQSELRAATDLSTVDAIAAQHGLGTSAPGLPQDLDRVGATHSETSSVDTDLEASSLAMSHGETETVLGQGALSSSSTSKTTGTLQVRGGVTGTVGSTESKSVTDAAGETKTSSTESSMTGGLVYASDGTRGLKAGVSGSSTSEEGLTVGGGLDGALTNRGASLGTQGSAEQEGEHFSGGARVAQNGSFTITPTALPDGRVQLVIQVRGGVSLDGDFGANSEEKQSRGKKEQAASASGGVGGSVSAAMTLTHILTAPQATAAMASIDGMDTAPAGVASTFELLAKLQLASQSRGNLDLGQAVVGDSASAAALPFGSSVELVLGGETHASLGARGTQKAGTAPGGAMAGTLGGSLSGAATAQRLVRVSPVQGAAGESLVEVFVSFDRSQTQSASGTLGVGAANGSAGKSGGSSAGQDVRFRLDPNSSVYDVAYQSILQCGTQGELLALKKLMAEQGLVVGETQREGSSQGTTAGIGLGGVQVSVGERREMVEEVSLGEGGDGYKGAASRRSASGSSVGGGSLEADSAEHTASAQYMDQKATLSFFDQASETEFAAGSGKGVGAIVETGIAAEFERHLLETKSSLRGYSVDSDDLDLMLARAEDERKWQQCVGLDPMLLEPWSGLRYQWRFPRPRPDWAIEDPIAALQICRLSALLSFLRDYGERGQLAVENLLRRYGVTWSGAGEGAADLGTLSEWPAEIAHLQPVYLSTQKYVAGLESSEPKGGSPAKVHSEQSALLLAASASVELLRNAVIACQGFQSERARAEVQDQLFAWQLALENAISSMAMDEDRSCVPVPAGTAEELLLRHIEHKHRQLFGMKEGERRLLYDLSLYAVDEESSTSRQLTKALYTSEGAGLMQGKLLDELSELHGYWILQVQELRRLYELADWKDLWKVSSGPGVRRHPDTEPDALRTAKAWAIHAYDGEAAAKKQLRRLSDY